MNDPERIEALIRAFIQDVDNARYEREKPKGGQSTGRFHPWTHAQYGAIQLLSEYADAMLECLTTPEKTP